MFRFQKENMSYIELTIISYSIIDFLFILNINKIVLLLLCLTGIRLLLTDDLLFANKYI